MAFELTTAEVSCYRRDGFVVRESVFTADEVAELCGAAERAVVRAAELAARGTSYRLDGNRFVDCEHVTVQFEHDLDSETIRVIEPVHELDSQLDALIDDPRIVEPMRTLVGCENIALWTGKLNLKRAGEGSGFRWHQDSPYWIHDSDDVDRLPNVYVALDDAAQANGCLRVVRGSHLKGCLPGLEDGSQLEGFYTSPEHFDESQQMALEVPAGSLAFFDPHTVHGSLPNTSDQPRRAMVLTYQPGDLPMLKSGRTRNVQVQPLIRG
jgi:ectoine hydroxylase-related dioxygenase (phytanoyl-CoA dioxygenase family)